MSDALPSWRDTGAEKALAAASDRGYTVVSVKEDWATVFADTDD